MEDDSDRGLVGFIKSFVKRKAHLDNTEDLAEEIHDLMDEGQAKGLISDEETDMVYAVLNLKETKAHSVMIPRTEISSAAHNATLGEVIELVKDCGHTRIPIHHENIDKIVGILHAKDLLRLWGQDPDAEIPADILRKPYFVPGTQKISELLRNLKERKTHLAIVTDEYGGTEGIITIEDIMEEIVGEILDEHDNERPLIKNLDDGSVLVDARLEVGKLEDHLGIELPKGDFESVGGFVIHLLGRIPQVNEEVRSDDLAIRIQKGDQRKIDEIHISRLPRSEAPVDKEENADD